MSKSKESCAELLPSIVPSDFFPSNKYKPYEYKIGKSEDIMGFLDPMNKLSKKIETSPGSESDDAVVPFEFFPTPTTGLTALYPQDYKYVTDDVIEGREDKYVRNPICFGKGKHVDIIDILSNSGKRDYLVNKHGVPVPVNSLVGKYVVLLCTPVPIPNSDAEAVMTCRSIISACSRLASKVVIVIAAENLWGSEDHFKHFLSGFSDDTLAIPFSDGISRDHLTYSAYWICRGYLNIIVVGPNGKVLQTDDGYKFAHYGSDFFPFTTRHLQRLERADEILKLKLDTFYKKSKKWEKFKPISGVVDKLCSEPRPSLHSLLGVQYLLKCDGSETRSVSELSKKVVGIYLCEDGSCLDDFCEFEQRCLNCDPDFQMVLVCLALLEDYRLFLDRIKLALKKRNINSWWLALPNERTCRKLLRLGMCVGDELFIMPPDGNSVELEGRFVAQIPTFRDTSYYPFTRESILKQRLHKLQSLTIVSLLKDFKVLAGEDGDLPLAYLQGKKIILYLDSFDENTDDSAHKLLLHNYSGIKSKHTNSEVLFLPNVGCEMVPKMPWLMLPGPSDYVANMLFVDMPRTDEPWYGFAFIAFGENGKILSRTSVETHLLTDDIASLFNDDLQKEIFDDLADLESSYGCY